ncbi:hypothetical protein PYCCODRAFT_1438056 [Trametes coccinea BRFM310]|uniref:Secreted protein n=1 Tax=Trametes coccinea (strain BRFM310) TaxID=1353009 RepID=A0A1Y2IF23_TRAC3|nr:hypothetical protein PYCCODRAFT_1438056 [Trametes coccinea BRFM310]
MWLIFWYLLMRRPCAVRYERVLHDSRNAPTSYDVRLTTRSLGDTVPYNPSSIYGATVRSLRHGIENCPLP